MNRIKLLRNSNNWSQKELAKKIGVSEGSISLYEKEERKPSLDILIKLSKLFNCSIDYLMGLDDFKYKLTPSYISTIYDFSNNSDKAILNYCVNYAIQNRISNIYDNETIQIELDKLKTLDEDLAKKIIQKLSAEYKDLDNFSFDEWQTNNHYNKSKLNLNEKTDEYFTNKYMLNKLYSVPLYGKISAGMPNWAEECLEGYLPVDPELMHILNPEEYFFLRVNGESMNKVVKNGAYALIHRQDIVNDGEIAVVLVNGDEATIKEFSKKNDIVVLTPKSDDETFKQQIYDKTTPIRVLGKYVGKLEIN